jgi:hypothetical protein
MDAPMLLYFIQHPFPAVFAAEVHACPATCETLRTAAMI